MVTDRPKYVPTVNELQDKLVTALGQLALTEQRLRDLVEAAEVVEGRSLTSAVFQMALTAARTLLQGEEK